MPLDIEVQAEDKTVAVRASGRPSQADYQAFVPELERLIREHGRIRVLFALDGLQPWDLAGLWQNVDFDKGQLSAIERVALLGNSGWQQLIGMFLGPSAGKRIRCFDRSQESEARTWLANGG